MLRTCTFLYKFPTDAYTAVGSLHLSNVESVSDVPEVHTVSVFDVEV
jgi:hypothetical protein